MKLFSFIVPWGDPAFKNLVNATVRESVIPGSQEITVPTHSTAPSSYTQLRKNFSGEIKSQLLPSRKGRDYL